MGIEALDGVEGRRAHFAKLEDAATQAAPELEERRKHRSIVEERAPETGLPVWARPQPGDEAIRLRNALWEVEGRELRLRGELGEARARARLYGCGLVLSVLTLLGLLVVL